MAPPIFCRNKRPPCCSQVVWVLDHQQQFTPSDNPTIRFVNHLFGTIFKVYHVLRSLQHDFYIFFQQFELWQPCIKRRRRRAAIQAEKRRFFCVSGGRRCLPARGGSSAPKPGCQNENFCISFQHLKIIGFARKTEPAQTRSGVSMPRRRNPCRSTPAVIPQSLTLLSRTPSSALRKGRF